MFSEGFFPARESGSICVAVESACGEQDVVVTMALWCMCACVCLFGFIGTITFIFMDGLRNDSAQFLFSLMSGCAISRSDSGRSKVKVAQTR